MKYQGLMGKYEMELAVKAIVEKSINLKIPLKELTLSDEDFSPGHALTGFYELVENGWIGYFSAYENIFYVPKDYLIERINKRLKEQENG